jgi:NADPH:quinone reductase
MGAGLKSKGSARAGKPEWTKEKRRTDMRVMRAEGFKGYEDLKLADTPKPDVSEGRVLVRITAAGVTPLEHTILSGGYPKAKAPLILGSEGAGVVEDANGSEFSLGARVMFTGPYGVSEDGTYSEYLAVRKEHLNSIPANIDDVSAAGLPVAYLTAYMALILAGFQAGKTVLAPAIGGSVGNAVTQLARALGATHAMSTTTSHAKAEQARAMGFDEVIDLSTDKLGEGVHRITQGYGSDIVIDAIGGDGLSEALGTLAMGGSLTTLGYAAGRKSTIDVTNLIWRRASIKSFSLFAQPSEMWRTAWKAIYAVLESGAVKPIVARIFALEEAAEALRYQIEDRPFGRTVLKI